MKKIVRTTYEATIEEIRALNAFRDFLSALIEEDEEIYEDFDAKVNELGIYNATRWLLYSLEKEEE